MSLDEPGHPYFDEVTPTPHRPFPGARLTTAGLYRRYPITKDSPHEPWCMHFEWGPCTCAPREGETWVGHKAHHARDGGPVERETSPAPQSWWGRCRLRSRRRRGL